METTAFRNRDFYDKLWNGARFYGPEHFNTWSLLSSLAKHAAMRLELGPGLRPRLPVAGTHFVDLSQSVVTQLNERGGKACVAELPDLVFPDDTFDLVGAFDIVEHVDQDRVLFEVLARIVKPGGSLIFSVPVHQASWTQFDVVVGHVRRYDPNELVALLASYGFSLEASAAFGMKPRSSFWSNFGVWWLRRFPHHAVRYYNKWFFPIALRRQEELDLQPGLVDTSQVEGLILRCRRQTG